MLKLLTALMPLIFVFSQQAEARVHWSQPVGEYETTHNLADHKGQSFLSFMKKTLYPAIKAKADQERFGRDNLLNIRQGKGVELRLTEDVSTYHIGYKRKGQEKAERSGRSFGVVGFEEGKAVYIADASYKHYLNSLEKALEDTRQAQAFYEAILKVLLNSDPSGIDQLSTKTKRVAADFVAVYVAEQYRRMIPRDGKIGPQHAWDDAHLQVTLVANFHAGQSKEVRGMFFRKKYLTSVYKQKDKIDGKDVCAYQLARRGRFNTPTMKKIRRSPFDLSDYWQFGRKCERRSGVNITRRDFERMGYKVTQWLNDNGLKSELSQIYELSGRKVRTFGNINKSFTRALISERAPAVFTNVDQLIEAMTFYLMASRSHANFITETF